MFGVIKLSKAKADRRRITAQAEGSEEPIPNGEKRGEIRVGFGLIGRVMNFMHSWRDNEET